MFRVLYDILVEYIHLFSRECNLQVIYTIYITGTTRPWQRNISSVGHTSVTPLNSPSDWSSPFINTHHEAQRIIHLAGILSVRFIYWIELQRKSKFRAQWSKNFKIFTCFPGVVNVEMPHVSYPQEIYLSLAIRSEIGAVYIFS